MVIAYTPSFITFLLINIFSTFFNCKQNRHDEMFVILGKDLISDILQKPYCHPETFNNCTDPKILNIDTNFGGTSLGFWLENIDNVRLVKANDEVVHYKNKQFYQKIQQKYVGHTPKDNFCEDYLLFHKASVRDMTKLNGS